MNTKEPELVDRFIELRAQGWSFNRIADEIGVSRCTLIAWSRKHQHRLRNLQAVETEALAEQCKVSARHSMQALAASLRRLEDELAGRDLHDIPTARLVLLIAALRTQVARLSGPLHLSESAGNLTQDETACLDPVIDWQV